MGRDMISLKTSNYIWNSSRISAGQLLRIYLQVLPFAFVLGVSPGINTVPVTTITSIAKTAFLKGPQALGRYFWPIHRSMYIYSLQGQKCPKLGIKYRRTSQWPGQFQHRTWYPGVMCAVKKKIDVVLIAGTVSTIFIGCSFAVISGLLFSVGMV